MIAQTEKAPSRWRWLLVPPMLLALPFIIVYALILMAGMAILAFFGGIADYFSERKLIRRMKQCGRYLSPEQAQARIAHERGTIILDEYTVGWCRARVWWTPDDVQTVSPHPIPVEEERFDKEPVRATDWDRWAMEQYTCPEHGSAFLLRTWDGRKHLKNSIRLLKDVPSVTTWTGLVHLERDMAAKSENDRT